MTVDLEKVKEKIRRLKSLATNGAAAVGEVANALAAAEKLCQEYNLVLSEIDETQQIKEIRDSIKERRVEVKHSRINLARSMNTLICKLYECFNFFNYDNTYQTLIGTESDIELALYAMDVAHNAMDLGWKNYMKTDEFEDYIEDGFKRNQIKRDYCKGFALQVLELVRAMMKDKDALKQVQTSKCTALIVRKEAEIEEYKNQFYSNLKSSHSRYSLTLTGAVESGKSDGSKVRFDKAVTTSNNKTMIEVN